MGRYVDYSFVLSFFLSIFLSVFLSEDEGFAIYGWMTLTVGQVVAIIDIDCAELNGFTAEDQEALEELAGLLAESCDFPALDVPAAKI